MRDDWFWNGPSLREETRTARGHALELLFSVAGGSILLGLSINLFSSWLFQALSGEASAVIYNYRILCFYPPTHNHSVCPAYFHHH